MREALWKRSLIVAALMVSPVVFMAAWNVLGSPFDAFKAQAVVHAQEYGAAVLKNHISGLYIQTNSATDCSVKFVSGDATKNVTVVRYAGPGAFDKCGAHYQFFKNFFDLVGVPVD